MKLLIALLAASLTASALCLSPALLQDPTTAQEPPPKTEATASEAIARILEEHGLKALTLERMVSGHLLMQVSINGSTPRRFVCDTGAGVTVVFPDLAEELGLVQESSDSTAGGIGGDGMELASAKIKKLGIDGVEFTDREITVLDLSYLNEQFAAVGEEPIEGIIGAPWLDQHEAVIDMKANTVWARP